VSRKHKCTMERGQKPAIKKAKKQMGATPPKGLPGRMERDAKRRNKARQDDAVREQP